MKTTSMDLTVGSLAAQYPAATRIFERLGIDYCCGGSVPLADACSAKGVEWTAVLSEAEAGGSQKAGTDWQTAPLPELIEHIVSAHHVYLRTNLPRIEALLGKVRAAHSRNHGEMLERVSPIFEALKDELLSHLDKEEQILFPMIRQLAAGRPQAAHSHCGSVSNPIRVMLMEHDSAGDALAALRSATSDYRLPEDACNTFKALYFELSELEKDLHQHIHLENNILFPRAIALP
jgi:regulator of cell morphogenesis and NO signaling